MSFPDDALETFVALSAVLTGFERVDLYGTGQADAYWQTVVGAVGDENAAVLLATATAIQRASGDDLDALERATRQDILASARLGPMARNIIQLWYLGTWFQMPATWSAEYGVHVADTTRIVSAEAYQQSLVYDVMRAHPPGAKQPGYSSWHTPPEPYGKKLPPAQDTPERGQ